MIEIKVKCLPHHEGLPLPQKKTDGAAGFDIVAACTDEITLSPMERKAIETGFCLEISAEYEVQIRPRSGLALNHGITVVNAPGTIDADYRGEVKILLINLGDDTFTIKRGDRIAQMVVAPVIKTQLLPNNVLKKTARGDGGFGSTGVSLKG